MLYVGWSYLYSRDSGFPPAWFLENMKDYLESFLPAYVSRYAGMALVVEGAPSYSKRAPDSTEPLLPYLQQIKDEVSGGYDAFLAMVDKPFSKVDPECFDCAGENFYLDRPNFAVAAVWDWNKVEEAASSAPRDSYLKVRYYAQMLGRPTNMGINALAVAGHEMMHFALLKKGGASLAAKIDGAGTLAGMSYFDYGGNPVTEPNFRAPNFRYGAQRISEELPCQSALGAYGCPNLTVVSRGAGGIFF
jgi:hypothetical protein